MLKVNTCNLEKSNTIKRAVFFVISDLMSVKIHYFLIKKNIFSVSKITILYLVVCLRVTTVECLFISGYVEVEIHMCNFWFIIIHCSL